MDWINGGQIAEIMAKCSFHRVVLLLLFIGPVRCNSTVCAYVNQGVTKEIPQKSANEGSESGSGSKSSSSSTALPEGLPINGTTLCKSMDKCYALWTEEIRDNKTVANILKQGCWEASGKCDQPECETDGRPTKAMTNTKFCCCTGDMCNVNVSESEMPPYTEEPAPAQTSFPGFGERNYGKETVIITVTSVISVFVVITAVFVTYRRWLTARKPSPDSVHLMEAPPPPSPTFDLENLKLIEMVGRGRYGSVWRGTLSDAEVAAKVFVHQHRQYYLNERDIYTLPFMEHPSLMKFIGAEERPSGPDGTSIEYYIVMAHAPFGCLQDYLRHNVLDWTSLCRMTQSIAKGLAHLHTDIRRGDKMKPCISHRDINSRNVLVRADRSCALCDMGFAMKIAGSKYYSQSGEEQHAETTSLTDVGTLRYMAPEVLEGAVNLRDCESSLKQIDVYALGLVLWEVATRCADLYQGLEVPEYKLPFEVEIGLHPTFEQMQVLVSRHKARPLFPDVWKDTNLAVRLLKETIEDCWDQDAEARLTSLCVEERLHELPILWERHKTNIGVNGVSPTVNSTFSQISCSRQPTFLGYGSTAPATTTGGTMMDMSSGSEFMDRNANIMGIVSLADTSAAAGVLAGRGGLRCSNWQRQNQNRESSVSENTVETSVTMSPEQVELLQPLSKNVINSQVFPWLPAGMPLQPHQGRNPCLERNMIMEPLEEISISGNTLLEKGCRNKALLRPRDPTPDVGELFDALHLVDAMESNSLVNHDVLGQSSRNCHPITYVQNAVHSTRPVCPKQPNLPGNGHSQPSKSVHHKRGTCAGRFERKKGVSCGSNSTGKRGKDWGGIRSLLDWTRLTRSAGSGGEEEDKGAKGNLSNGTVEQRAMSDSTLNTEKSNLSSQRHRQEKRHPQWQQQPPLNHKVQTQVCLVGGGLSGGELGRQTVERLTTNGRYTSTELGVAKLHLQNGHAPVVKIRSGPQSELQECSSLGPVESNVDSSPETKMKRPNSLFLKGKNLSRPKMTVNAGARKDNIAQERSLENVNVSRKSMCSKVKSSKINDAIEEGTKRKIEQRVKTPFELKPGRFSLYDDRMMFSWEESKPSGKVVNKSKFSLSVPIDINSLCTVQAEDFLLKYNPRANEASATLSTDGSGQVATRTVPKAHLRISPAEGHAAASAAATNSIKSSASGPNLCRDDSIPSNSTNTGTLSAASSSTTVNPLSKFTLPSTSSPNNIQGRLNNHTAVCQVSCI